jgi:hypothetical protein
MPAFFSFEAEASAESSGTEETRTAAATRCSQTWAMLIKRVYEVDPLSCPQCGGEMKVVAFIESPTHIGMAKLRTSCGISRDRLVFCDLPGHNVTRHRQMDAFPT